MKQEPTRPARASQAIGSTGWQRAIMHRVGTDGLLKASSTMIAIAVFFAAYFWVLHHPIGHVTTMPVLAVDRWLAFEFATMPLYLSLWVYLSLGPALLPDRRMLLGYGVACALIAMVGLALFLFWPTKVPPLTAEVAAEVADNAGMALLRGVDMSGNACPSLHVAFAVFAAAGLARELRLIGAPGWLRGLSIAWCMGIVYSTLATRQHVVLDVAAGALLGALVALAHARWERGVVRPSATLPIRVRSAAGKP